MKLYKITSPYYEFADKVLTGSDDAVTAPRVTEWAGTQADARKIRIGYEEQFKEIKPLKRPKVTVEEVDVPTDKAGLLGFLNGIEAFLAADPS
jgi:hypothetical protein